MSWEFQLLYALQKIHNPILDAIMKGVTLLGDGGLIWIVLALVFIIFFKKYRGMGIQMAAAMLLTVIIGNLILKNLVARSRPCWLDPDVQLLVKNPKDYSFPSGHSMNGFTAALIIFLNERKMGIFALIAAALIAFSRLYLFVHFPTDVLGGMLIGIADAVIVFVCWRKYKDRIGFLKKL